MILYPGQLLCLIERQKKKKYFLWCLIRLLYYIDHPSNDKTQKRLSYGLVGLELKDSKIVKDFQFPSFMDATRFVNKVAEI